MSKIHRLFIEISYDGTAYHGWQIQENSVSVQELVNQALSTVLRQPVETVGCGRTDTGVHAKQLYAHFDISEENIFENPQLIIRINSILPPHIAIKRIIEVPQNAHARFDAISRSYEYHIHFNKDPFKHNLSWLLHTHPDVELMNEAAKILLSYQDFSCFSKSNTQTMTNNCTISKAEWVEENNGLVFHITADRFLRNMVRAIVGTLLKVGKHEINPEEIRQIIESKNRSNAGVSVPACGLYLTKVVYKFPL
ncbi:MAG: tRNA pseudouridine(38-40) synthase TruA [Daejeonella sp.]